MLRLAAPSFPEAALEAALDVLRSGMLVQGERVARFEEALAGYLGVPHVVAVSSGTAALHLSMLAAGIRPGDEVIVPAFTFPATANAVVVSGGRPVLVDIDPRTHCIQPAAIDAAVTPRTRFLLPVHEFGQAADIPAIMALAARHGLRVIEDAACAFGTRSAGRPVGGFGLCGCFSFHPRKALTTGEGGAITTSDADFADRVRRLRNHGIQQTPDGPDFTMAGLNYRMTEFQAALGIHQVPEFERGIELRIRQAALYRTHLSSVPGLELPQESPGREAVYQTFHVVLPPGTMRRDVIAELRGKGIETNLGAQALNCLSFFRTEYGYTPATCPIATRSFERGLALPIGAHCSDDDIRFVAETLAGLLVGAGRTGCA